MDRQTKRRSAEEMVLLSMSAFSSMVIAPFAFFRFTEQQWPSFFADLALLIGLITVFISVYITHKVELAGRLVIAVAVIGLCFVVNFNGVFPIYWSYPVIIATYFLIVPTVAVLSAWRC